MAETKPWAYIDTNLYWQTGSNIVGTYGKVDFVSDKVSRDLTRRYQDRYTPAGRYLDRTMFIIKVISQVDNMQLIALYDDVKHDVLFDSPNLEDFCLRLDIWVRFDDSNDIVQMAKRVGGKKVKK